ncbi:MAG TPA: ABC transporter permease [Candidatus Omnitrophota bacterium]|nr:ABC transporter permease [Candidatus Omnitrophota bacterium]HOX09164.1 ABC transporter permease [Candidatus Omnitrophota bacterium]HPN66415.1 ABC transporter permease [Candidatus Omnitrophota bacterium]HRZ66584.1 ABC transporter permease [Candidatus Omnitrophota bacterium]
MVNYIARRLIGMVPVLIGITLITFFVIHLSPGKPTRLQAEMSPKISLEAREKLDKLYGLDKPVYIQYWEWVKRLARFDLGKSFVDDRPVSQKIGERIPVTITINVLSLALIFLAAVPIGITSAVREGSAYDRISTVFVFIGFAMPTFWLALLLMNLFGVHLGWLPVSGIKSIDFEDYNLLEKLADLAVHLALPVFVSAFVGLAGISRYMRTSMLEVLNKDFVRTARAKGLPERQVIYKHALKNALLPIVTIMGLSVPGLIGGSVIFESIYAIPGMGKLFYDSVMARDYPVIMGVLFIGAILTLIGNLVADVIYACVDPRIRVTGR